MPDRVRECMWLFAEMVDVEESIKLYGIPIRKILRELPKDVSRAILDNEEKAEGILFWLANAIHYMAGEIDDLPRIDLEWKIE